MFGFTAEVLNGQLAVVESIQPESRSPRAIILHEGKQKRVPVDGLIPVPDDTAPFREPEKVLSVFDVVRTAPGGSQFSDKLGVIAKLSGTTATITLVESFVSIKANRNTLIDASSERPEPQPHLIVQHKNEQSGRDPIGPAYLIDPRIYKDELRPFNPKRPDRRSRLQEPGLARAQRSTGVREVPRSKVRSDLGARRTPVAHEASGRRTFRRRTMTPDQQLPQQGNIPETPRAASFPAQDQANAAKLYLQPEVGEIYSEDDLIATYERDTPGLTHADYEETLRDAVLKGCLVALDFCVDVRVEGEPHARVPADVVYEQGRLDDDAQRPLYALPGPNGHRPCRRWSKRGLHLLRRANAGRS